MDKNRTKKWIIIFAALLAACLLAVVLLRHFAPQGRIAVIRVDGKIYEKIDLDAVNVAYNMEIETEYGYNKLRIEHDGISVVEADCRDRICVNQGKLGTAGSALVCLPHRLTVQIEGGGIDA